MNITIEQKSAMIHSVMGVLVGILTAYLTADPIQIGNITVLVMAISLLLLTGQAVQKIFKLTDVKDDDGDPKYNFKWWLSNGGMIYLGFWVIVWIALYNSFLI